METQPKAEQTQTYVPRTHIQSVMCCSEFVVDFSVLGFLNLFIDFVLSSLSLLLGGGYAMHFCFILSSLCANKQQYEKL